MHGHRIGYVRVSSLDQNPERQLSRSRSIGSLPTRLQVSTRSVLNLVVTAIVLWNTVYLERG